MINLLQRASSHPDRTARWREGECKVGDWGLLEGRFVLLDYGAECHTEGDIAAARATLMRYVDKAEASVKG